MIEPCEELRFPLKTIRSYSRDDRPWDTEAEPCILLHLGQPFTDQRDITPLRPGQWMAARSEHATYWIAQIGIVGEGDIRCYGYHWLFDQREPAMMMKLYQNCFFATHPNDPYDLHIEPWMAIRLSSHTAAMFEVFQITHHSDASLFLKNPRTVALPPTPMQ